MAWSKESRHARGYGSAWDKISAAIRKRDGDLCQACLAKGILSPWKKTQRFAVDHIVPKSKGGGDDADNLQVLCGACHAAKTEREAAEAQGRRQRRTIGIDGWPE